MAVQSSSQTETGREALPLRHSFSPRSPVLGGGQLPVSKHPGS